MLESLLKKFAGLTPILKKICQQLLLYCNRTTRCNLFVLPLSQETNSMETRTALIDIFMLY